MRNHRQHFHDDTRIHQRDALPTNDHPGTCIGRRLMRIGKRLTCFGNPGTCIADPGMRNSFPGTRFCSRLAWIATPRNAFCKCLTVFRHPGTLFLIPRNEEFLAPTMCSVPPNRFRVVPVMLRSSPVILSSANGFALAGLFHCIDSVGCGDAASESSPFPLPP